jgi:hypothetical protein
MVYIIITEREVDKMKMCRIIVWFIVLNFVCEHIWTEPVSEWWVIEIIILGISCLMVDK